MPKILSMLYHKESCLHCLSSACSYYILTTRTAMCHHRQLTYSKILLAFVHVPLCHLLVPLCLLSAPRLCSLTELFVQAILGGVSCSQGHPVLQLLQSVCFSSTFQGICLGWGCEIGYGRGQIMTVWLKELFRLRSHASCLGFLAWKPNWSNKSFKET